MTVEIVNGQVVMVAPGKQKVQLEKDDTFIDLKNRRICHTHLRKPSKRAEARAWADKKKKVKTESSESEETQLDQNILNKDEEKLYEALFVFGED